MVPRLLAVVGLGVLLGVGVAVVAYGIVYVVPVGGVGWVTAALGFAVFSVGLQRLLDAAGVTRGAAGVTRGAAGVTRGENSGERSKELTPDEEARFQEARAQLRNYEQGRDGSGEAIFWLLMLGLSVFEPPVESVASIIPLLAIPVAHELGHLLQKRVLGYKDTGLFVVLFARQPQLGAVLGTLGWLCVGAVALDHGSWPVGVVAFFGVWWNTWRYRLGSCVALLRQRLGAEAMPLWARDAPEEVLRSVVVDWQARWERGPTRATAIHLAMVMSRVYQQATIPTLSLRTQLALGAAHLGLLLPIAMVLRGML